MSNQELKVKCLELALKTSEPVIIEAINAGKAQIKNILTLAQEYYEWVTITINEPVEPVSND